jgi:hypothetical protein
MVVRRSQSALKDQPRCENRREPFPVVRFSASPILAFSSVSSAYHFAWQVILVQARRLRQNSGGLRAGICDGRLYGGFEKARQLKLLAYAWHELSGDGLVC